ncbi:MAG TPA: peptidoglycan editing factor PgeF [Alphaproteobacteria bacterium]|nr:peptidoglycan editing factor PgeF [Alphaproteobacteria bacterium]
MLTSASLAALPGVRHGFFTREGGVSRGIYASLNCGYGSGDSRADVGENRARVAAQLGLGGDALITIHQVHSPDVTIVERPWAPGEAPRGDAMVTARPGIGLGILAADCGPVLFADAEAGVIGAAHAGWRGALGGVLEATVEAMETLGARRERIAAALGPCIAQASYEVGPEFRDGFLARAAGNARYFVPSGREGHHRFDLPGYVLDRLVELGLGAAERLHNDTYAEADGFFSFRRATHRGEPDYGRQISAIALA